MISGGTVLRRALGAALLLLTPAAAAADMIAERIPYTIDGDAFEGMLVYDGSVAGPRPAVVMAPNWMGVTEAAVAKAQRVAGQRYVVLIADMYGAGTRPQNAGEARAAAGAVRADIDMMRRRISAAVDVLVEQGNRRNLVAAGKVAAIGFCFGGGNSLELARSGRDIRGVVSFHGSLTTPRPEDAANIRAKILVLHGAADPAVPKRDRDALEAELSAAPQVDWQMVVFSGAVHSFTDPTANVPGANEYNEAVAARAFAMMHAFFEEIF